MKRFILLLGVVILLCGCLGSSQVQQAPTAPSPSVIAQTTPTTQLLNSPSLAALQQAAQLEENANFQADYGNLTEKVTITSSSLNTTALQSYTDIIEAQQNGVVFTRETTYPFVNSHQEQGFTTYTLANSTTVCSYSGQFLANINGNICHAFHPSDFVQDPYWTQYIPIPYGNVGTDVGTIAFGYSGEATSLLSNLASFSTTDAAKDNDKVPSSITLSPGTASLTFNGRQCTQVNVTMLYPAGELSGDAETIEYSPCFDNLLGIPLEMQTTTTIPSSNENKVVTQAFELVGFTQGVNLSDFSPPSAVNAS